MTMLATTFHPAAIELLRLQSRGRRRRVWRKFCQPRRLILSAIACLLAIVWLANAAMTIWLREAASTETLRVLLSFGLLSYALWHIVKAAFFRPESPFDWTPVEHDLLLAMPLRPRDLVTYQIASVTSTTLLKAGLFTLLLLPDLRCLPLGLAGIILAMMLLEMLRLAIDIVAWGVSRSAYLGCRAAVVAALVVGGLAITATILNRGSFGEPLDENHGVRQHILDQLIQLSSSRLGYVELPFQPFIDLIVADSMTAGTALVGLVAVAMVLGLAFGVLALYSFMVRVVADREKRSYRSVVFAQASLSALTDTYHPASARLRVIHSWLWLPWCRGAGPLAWRQLVGARRHWGSLLTAMIAPAVLAASPCFLIADANMALVATAGTLAFYTFLLLPTALRFDFRRDLDRLALLKGLPISAAATTLGQTLAPVLIATLFQTGVLAFAIIMRSLPLHHLFFAILVMTPLNALVFALDNLIYLLYPYRIQQEGLEIFLRTMLTFTGKGLLFALAMAATAAWGASATALSATMAGWTGSAISAPALFIGGMIVGPLSLAAAALYVLCRTYQRLDPIEDLPR